MVERKDILSLGFLKLSPFTGSSNGLRYRIEKVSEEENDYLMASAWFGPFSYDNTHESEIETNKSDFSEEGLEQLVDWLNERGNI